MSENFNSHLKEGIQVVRVRKQSAEEFEHKREEVTVR
jgi:hypothetical protein